jgi:phytoene dehydrogenase-like protein
LIERTHHLIVGAGAAGSAAAKCFASANLANSVVWLEQHSEPGGSAGYFSRGSPKRTFDAGATQLVECAEGLLQEQLFSLTPARQQEAASQIFERIPTITQHWPGQNRSVQLSAEGHVTWASKRPPSAEEKHEVALLENFLKICSTEAHWMWNLLGQIPRFPPQLGSDFLRALELFWAVPFKKKLLFPYLFFTNARQIMNRHKIPSSGLANDVISGLLVDTTQSTPEKSPWLAAAMGLSILSRGIYRCRKGMRSYFRPMVSAFEEHSGVYKTHEQIVKIETHSDGFLLTSKNKKNQQESQYLVERAALLNLTVWDIVGGLIPAKDPIRNTRLYRSWQRRAERERGWGALALYALVPDQPDWPETPHFHQIFPQDSEHPSIQTSLYVSIPSRNDPANPEGFRVLTATVHTEARALSNADKELFTAQLCKRIEAALGVTPHAVESATPRTFERYTARKEGQVGGFRLTLANFMFFAMPSCLVHPINKQTKLLLMGDTVFPGQGVVACSVSGIIAFERATNLRFRSLIKNYFGRSHSQ